MKRALVLLMVGSLVLAGCLHSGTVEQIDDKVPVLPTPMTSDQVAAAITLVNEVGVIDLNAPAAAEVYVKTVDDSGTSVITATMATDPAANSTRMQISGTIGGISMDVMEISGPAGINNCAVSGATTVCTYERAEAYENPFADIADDSSDPAIDEMVDIPNPKNGLTAMGQVGSWTVATTDDGNTHTATGSDAAFEYTVVFSGIPPALESMEMKEISGDNITRFTILDPSAFDFTIDTSVARISFSLEATESWWADTVADETALFACDDGSTVLFYLANDGTDDCTDGSDEERQHLFQCANGDTILFSGANDYLVPMDFRTNCADGSDDETYTCDDGDLVSLGDVNDEWPDCWDGSDEQAEFECLDGWSIPWEWLNDGEEDCDDGDDEDDGQGTMQFECDDGSRIGFDLVNDYQFDCADESDESMWQCDDGELIVFGDWGYPDWGCSDDSDSESVFICDDGSSVPFSNVNDFGDDCADGSDQTKEYWFDCYDNSGTLAFELVNDGQVTCDDGSDEVPFITSYTIAGEISEDHGDRISLTEVDLELGKAGSPLEQLTLSDGSVSVTDSSGDTWDVTYNDNDNDGFISPGDTYQILTSSNTQDLSVTFHDTWAGNVADYERAPASLAYKCECIPQQGWSIVPDPPAPDPILNTCPTCTSSADCSYGGCVLEKDSNPNLTKPQGCRWVTFHMLSADVIAQGTISNN